MERGTVPPCPETEPEHGTLEWATRRRNRKTGLVMMGLDKLYYQAGAGPEIFQHLEDGGFIEREYHGSTFRYRVVTPCTCPGGNPPDPVAARRRETILPRSGDVGEPQGSAVGGLVARATSRAAAKKSTPITGLAKDYFPQVMGGTPLDHFMLNWPALAHNLKLWQTNFDIGIPMMKLMMDEFARHPEWIRRSKTPPWRIFIAKREQLASMIVAQQRKDPGARTGTIRGASYWDRPTPRAYSPA